MTSAKIITDSLNVATGDRLTTYRLVYPRYIHAELMTHRVFCLAGDCRLEFDLPGGSKKGRFKRLHAMRLDEFVDKWDNGARRYGAKPKREADLGWIDPNQVYTSHEVAAKLGMFGASNVHSLCRNGQLQGDKDPNDKRTWLIQGSEILRWRTNVPEHTRFDMQTRLKGMRIRQLNELTGDIQHSHVINCCFSGVKPVFEVVAGDYSIAGSQEHRVLTAGGWKTIGELNIGDLLVVRKFGKRNDDLEDPYRLQKIDGRWKQTWNRNQRARLQAEDPLCRRCRQKPLTDVHHIIPVYQRPDLAFDQSNITGICEDCHVEEHRKQGWQGGTYLYGSMVRVDAIRLRGEEPTYDLEIAGQFPNFLANGVVVHNSRNAASSRAIPMAKFRKDVEDNPVIPIHWGANQKGMQATGELDDTDLTWEDKPADGHVYERYGTSRRQAAKDMWLIARDQALSFHEALEKIGLHKGISNRILEPWFHIEIICSATDYMNFFSLRCHEAAHPDIQALADGMLKEYVEKTPVNKDPGDWHLPFGDQDLPDGISPETAAKVCVARVARVSYKNFAGEIRLAEDVKLHDQLLESGHLSPFEHVAQALAVPAWSGNFKGWRQWRKTFANENRTVNLKDLYERRILKKGTPIHGSSIPG